MPDKPFFMYFAPGATHAPHHAPKDWIEKYKGKFDQGWDKLREETFERQKKLGVIPKGSALTARHEQIPSWDSDGC
jgi:arylsulfatase